MSEQEEKLRTSLALAIAMFERAVTDKFAPGVSPDEEHDYITALSLLPRRPPDPAAETDDLGAAVTRTHWCWSTRNEGGPFAFAATLEEALSAALADAPKMGGAYGVGPSYLMIGKAVLTAAAAKSAAAMTRPKTRASMPLRAFEDRPAPGALARKEPWRGTYPDNKGVHIYCRTRFTLPRARFELGIPAEEKLKELKALSTSEREEKLRTSLAVIIAMFECAVTDEFGPGVSPAEEHDYIAALRLLPRRPPDPAAETDDLGAAVTRTHWCWSARDEGGPFAFVSTLEEALNAALAAAPKKGGAYGVGSSYLMIGKAALTAAAAKRAAALTKTGDAVTWRGMYLDNKGVHIYDRTRFTLPRARFELGILAEESAR